MYRIFANDLIFKNEQQQQNKIKKEFLFKKKTKGPGFTHAAVCINMPAIRSPATTVIELVIAN